MTSVYPILYVLMAVLCALAILGVGGYVQTRALSLGAALGIACALGFLLLGAGFSFGSGMELPGKGRIVPVGLAALAGWAAWVGVLHGRYLNNPWWKSALAFFVEAGLCAAALFLESAARGKLIDAMYRAGGGLDGLETHPGYRAAEAVNRGADLFYLLLVVAVMLGAVLRPLIFGLREK